MSTFIWIQLLNIILNLNQIKQVEIVNKLR